jgi:multiple sugar transport system permease protein/putative aldouronate transport system permease protein
MIHPLTRKNTIRTANADRIYYVIVYSVILLLLIVVLYPLIYVLSASFSSPQAVTANKVILWPVDFSLKGYKAVFEYDSVWIGYRNTLFYTVAGTTLNLFLTMSAAYALSYKKLPGIKIFSFLFTFILIFSGGLVPTYLLMKNLGFVNSWAAMIFPNAINVTYLIIARTFLSGIPTELYEAAQIDGCSYTRYFFKIVLPLSKAIIAVLVLYYAVGHWNSYFNALIYLSNKNLFPLQLYLREILVMNSIDSSALLDPEALEAMQGMQDLLKYSLIVVATLPILCIYPFLQKYFAKGVMVGSIKG